MVFHKYQSLGNDYLVYDCNRNQQNISSSLISKLCDRHLGIGADGIVVGPFFTDKGLSVSIYNSDGTESEQGGNAVLIFAKYLKDAGYIQKKEFTLITKGGKNIIRYHNELGTSASVAMGKLDFSPEAVGCTFCPLNIASHSTTTDAYSNINTVKKGELVDVPMKFGDFTYRCTCVSVGNPHCVLPYRVVNKDIVCDIAEKINKTSYFINQVNTEIVQIIDTHNIKIEIFERGSGYTLASGSSACAAVGAMYKMGFVTNKVNVQMPGGMLLISIDEDLNVSMTGTVEAICRIHLSEEYRIY